MLLLYWQFYRGRGSGKSELRETAEVGMELQAAGRSPSRLHQKLQGGWHLGLEIIDRRPSDLGNIDDSQLFLPRNSPLHCSSGS